MVAACVSPLLSSTKLGRGSAAIAGRLSRLSKARPVPPTPPLPKFSFRYSSASCEARRTCLLSCRYHIVGASIAITSPLLLAGARAAPLPPDITPPPHTNPPARLARHSTSWPLLKLHSLATLRPRWSLIKLSLQPIDRLWKLNVLGLRKFYS